MIYVGAGSSIKTKGDLAIRGRDNRVVVSNGTLYVSQSGSSLRFGKSISDADETGNMLVFKGSSPKVARIDPDNNYPAQFYNGAVLRFEVPEDGYSGNAKAGLPRPCAASAVPWRVDMNLLRGSAHIVSNRIFRNKWGNSFSEISRFGGFSYGVHIFARMSGMLDLSRDEKATCPPELQRRRKHFLPR